TSLSFDSGEYDRGKLVSADVDNDGNSDLVWIAQSAHRFITWFGDGHGHFEISAVEKHRWLEVILTDERTQLADRSSGLDLAAVLFSGSLVVCRGFEYHAPLSLEAAIRTAETRTFDSTSGFPYKERPPPVTSL